MEASEEKRKQYKDLIEDIATEKLVYIDESSIDMNICKDRVWGKRNEKLLEER